MNTENVNSKMLKIKNCRTMLLSKCALRNSKKSRFMKEEEAKGFFSNLDSLVCMLQKYFKAKCLKRRLMHIKVNLIEN